MSSPRKIALSGLTRSLYGLVLSAFDDATCNNRNRGKRTMKTVSAKPSKLALLFREINQLGGKDASFLANVILHYHQRPMKKLKGLAKLLRAGHRVQTAQFSLNVLVID